MQVFFPSWMLCFIPPVIFGTLIFDFILDNLIIFLYLVVMRIPKKGGIMKKLFLRVWIVGFAIDAAAAVIFLIITLFGGKSVVAGAIDPFVNVGSFFLAFFIVALAGVAKFFVFKKILLVRVTELTVSQKRAISILLGIITAPWTYLIPTATCYLWMSSALGIIFGKTS